MLSEKSRDEAEPIEAARRSFTVGWRTHRHLILLVLLLAFALRLGLVLTSRPASADAKDRYIITATNLLDYHTFSIDQHPPVRPGIATAPLYPLFIAAVYSAFGRHERAVELLQAFIDMATCLLIAYVAFNLAPRPLGNTAALIALTIYGIFALFPMIWAARVLTETLTLFWTMLAITLIFTAHGRRGNSEARLHIIILAGFVCGLALLTRPDSSLLAFACAAFLALDEWRARAWRASFVNIAVFCFVMALTLAPWSWRNYTTFKIFQPLASEYGFAQPAYMPTGYLRWLRTWMVDETYPEVFPPAFTPGAGATYDPRQLSRDVFDSQEEREEVTRLIQEYDQRQRFTPEMNDAFQQLANERIRRAPLRFFLWTPLKRALSMWTTGFSAVHPPHRALRILSVLPIICGGIIGFALCRRRPLAWLLLLVIATRTIFMSYHYAPEARYIVEAYPPMIAACAVTFAALLQRCAPKLFSKFSNEANHHPALSAPAA